MFIEAKHNIATARADASSGRYQIAVPNTSGNIGNTVITDAQAASPCQLAYSNGIQVPSKFSAVLVTPPPLGAGIDCD